MKLKLNLNDELFLIKYIIRTSIAIIIASITLFAISGWKNNVDHDYFDKIDVTNKLISKIDVATLNVLLSDFTKKRELSVEQSGEEIKLLLKTYSVKYDDLMKQAYEYKLQSENKIHNSQKERDEELSTINRDNFFEKMGMSTTTTKNTIEKLNYEIYDISKKSENLATIQLILFLFLTIAQMINLLLATQLSLIKIKKQNT